MGVLAQLASVSTLYCKKFVWTAQLRVFTVKEAQTAPPPPIPLASRETLMHQKAPQDGVEMGKRH